MKKNPYTVSFRYLWQGALVETRKVFWLPRRPSRSFVVSVANAVLGFNVASSYSVVSGQHAWDGLIDPSSWRIMPLFVG